MRMVKKKRRRKANDLPAYKTFLFILNNLLDLIYYEVKVPTFQSLCNSSQFNFMTIFYSVFNKTNYFIF